MGWRDWFKSKPAWLKGGVIGAIIILVYNILSTLIIHLGFTIPIFFFVYYPIILFTFLFGWGIIFQGLQVYLIQFLLLPIFYFLIGALIGFIINKIKKRSKK